MNDEKRTDNKPVPDNVEEYLNLLQRDMLDIIKELNWRLKFVRRPSNDHPTVVLENLEGREIGVLEEDGIINFEPGIVIRDDMAFR